ncbi:MAG: helix-turn-helix domain-containing protein [Muribaculaceae bacterium]|nr:helix-turn-helix domain-containing protein [Muribaculaceae bacterium]
MKPSIISLALILLTQLIWLPSYGAGARTGRLINDPDVIAGEYSGFCQDVDGFLWIATNRGLIRFEGNDCDIYRHDDAVEGSLSDNRVLHVMSDSKGRIWVATANGLNLYMPESDSFQVITLPSKDLYGYINGLGEQSDGTVTFIVSGVGVYVVDDSSGNPVAVMYPGGLMQKDYNSIACCRNGKIFLGSHDGTVFCMAPNGKISPIKVTDESYILALAVEEDDNVIVSTLNEIYRIDSRSGSFSRLSIDGKISIANLSNSAGGKVYVATSGNGLWEVETKSDVVEKCRDMHCAFLDIDDAKIGAAYTSPAGDLWLGCNYRGIVLLPGRHIPFLYRKFSDSFPDFIGGPGALNEWKGHSLVALDKGRVVMYGSGGKVLMVATVPGASKITHIELIDGDKALIGVADDGIWELSLPSGDVRKFVDIPGKYASIVSAPGNDGELFIGVYGLGLMRYDIKTGEKKWIPYDPDGNQLTNPYITSLNHTADGKVWIGLYSGIACYDLKTDKLLELDQEPFLRGATFAIVPCMTDNSIWVGTSHGLIHFDPEKGVIRKYTTADGLSDNDVRTISRDHNGGKWIGTMNGLSYLTPDNSKILSYYGGNGLVETTFNQIKYSPSRKGIYLGSDLGITAFMPDSVPAPELDYKIKVSAMYLNGKRILPNMKSGCHVMIKGSMLSPEMLHLPYKDNALTLRLSTMDFRDASNIRYRWRLDKKDDWIETAPGDNMVYLPHLDPGKYDLEICAVENNAVSPVTLIKIRVALPWYWTGLAKVIYLVLLLVFIILAWGLFKKRRAEKINEEKIKFFTDVSHDIRTPMTLVMSPLESLMKEPHDSDVSAKLNVMHRNAQRVMGLLNQLLDISKLDKGKMRLSCRKTNAVAFVKELVELFATQAAGKKQTLTFTEISNPGDVWLDRDNFDKIMVNLISNAIKYTPDGGSIDVSVDTMDDEKLGKCLEVSVKDTGIGLDEKALPRLFEPFYRIREDHAPATMGFGIGLDLCRRLVMLHHGRITALNREDGIKGSVFTVVIPIEESFYGDGELIERPDEEDVQGRHLLMPNGSTAVDLPSRPKPLTAGGKVLVVDDDAELRGYLSSVLANYYKVKEAADGNEALKIVADWKPDLIVSDVVMPSMDGLTLLKRLKSNADTNHIPVILLSSKTAISDRMAGWDKGADGYLGKPFNIDELAALVDTLIENRLRMKGKFSGAQETEGKIDAPEMKGNDEVLLDRIMKEINAHIDDPELNVEKLASEVGVSRAHLHRKMKELIGMTPSDYIRNIRLKRACELLRRPDIEVTQVAYKIGFTSQPHFSSHFKRYTGFSPSEYRAKSLSGADVGVELKKEG